MKEIGNHDWDEPRRVKVGKLYRFNDQIETYISSVKYVVPEWNDAIGELVEGDLFVVIEIEGTDKYLYPGCYWAKIVSKGCIGYLWLSEDPDYMGLLEVQL